MKGYFGIGVERVSKAMNVGALFRTAHAFGASFVFTVDARYSRREGTLADTADSTASLPHHDFKNVETLRLPVGCRLVGVEITDDAIALPSFRHPRQAAYVLGAEREGLSEGMIALCDYVVRIPTRFSVNLSVAGALVMYDRLVSLGRFAPRPVATGGPVEPPPLPVFGAPLYQRKQRRRAEAAARAGKT
ncbi:MAG: RNA methyltransferase [Reyranellaceae bacterium]